MRLDRSESIVFAHLIANKPHPKRKRRLVLTVSLVAAILLTACTGSDDDGDALTGTTTAPTADGATTSGTDLLLNAALQAHVEGRTDDAAVLYREVLALDDKNKYAHFNLGLLAHTRGDLDEATQSYEKALSTDPSYVPALFNLGIVHAESGGTEAAIESYRQAIAGDDSYAAAHLNLGVLLLQSGQEKEGLEEINRAYRLDPALVLESQPAP